MAFKMDWDLDIYLHERGDEVWIALGSTPSELALNHDTIDASNEDGIRVASIKATKKYVEKLPKRGMDCQTDVTAIQYKDCAMERIRTKFAESGGCTTGRLRDCCVERLRDCCIAWLRDCCVARLRDCCVARLRDC
jgi:hypothetical protein